MCQRLLPADALRVLAARWTSPVWLQVGEPYWLPEVGLEIGRYLMELGALQQEGLAWYD